MYVRQAWKRDEAWLLDQFEEYGLDYAGFRSRDYVIAIDDDGTECGFGCVATHDAGDDEFGELRNIRVTDDSQQANVRRDIITKLLEKAEEDSLETVYHRTDSPVESLSFEDCTSVPAPLVDDEADAPVYVTTVRNALGKKSHKEQLEELAKEFGYDDDTTTKYSI